MSNAAFDRYIALGDSLTEPQRPRALGDGSAVHADAGLVTDWAERLAGILSGHASLGGRLLQFTNLATPDDSIRRVVEVQVPQSIALGADLVSMMIGNAELVAQRADPDTLAADLESGVRALRLAGANVLLAGSFDPRSGYALARARARAAAFNANVWGIARANGCTVLDLWGMREFQLPSMWAIDRVHLSTQGHRALAARAAHTLHVPYAEIVVRPSELLPRTLPAVSDVSSDGSSSSSVGGRLSTDVGVPH